MLLEPIHNFSAQDPGSHQRHAGNKGDKHNHCKKCQAAAMQSRCRYKLLSSRSWMVHFSTQKHELAGGISEVNRFWDYLDRLTLWCRVKWTGNAIANAIMITTTKTPTSRNIHLRRWRGPLSFLLFADAKKSDLVPNPVFSSLLLKGSGLLRSWLFSAGVNCSPLWVGESSSPEV